ncbi:MAG: exo-alpha-sialidase [Deltaproteobacteria bacterium]|nr:exo-alpha-sialidase [Deltaproteobacteria bacterium]
MIRHIALAVLLGATGVASANGRPAGTSTITFRQNAEQHILAGMTFGLLSSKDNGATWQWMCEKAVLYGGMYDPDYVYHRGGAWFATTFDGALVNRDGCVFQPMQFGKKFFSSVTQGPDGAILMAAADVPGAGNPGDAKIYRSTDGGMTFNNGATAGMINDWYNSLEVAPTDASRVYLSGYRITDGIRSWQIYKSLNGGTSFTPVTSTGFTTSENSNIDVVGIKVGTPDTVFVRVTITDGSLGDAIWRSDNAGQSWTKIFPTATFPVRDNLSLVARANGDLVIASSNSGMYVARGPTNATWEMVAGAPHVNCLVENTAGELWACTQNFGSPGFPSDDAGIMKTTNLTSWTKVLRYQDIQGPIDCPVGTRQHNQCVYDCPDATFDENPALCAREVPKGWCGLKNLYGITWPGLECPAVFDSPPENDVGVSKKPGCCSAGDYGGGSATLVLALGVGTVILRSRRRRIR